MQLRSNQRKKLNCTFLALTLREVIPLKKMGQNFHICLRSGPTGLTTPPPSLTVSFPFNLLPNAKLWKLCSTRSTENTGTIQTKGTQESVWRGLKKPKFMSVFFQKPRESCNIRHVLYVFFAQLKIAMLKRISVRLFLFSGAEQLQKAKVLIADADVWAHFAYHYLRQGQGGILPFLWHLIDEIIELKYIGNGNTRMLSKCS